MAISAKDVMELRKQTDCGMMECKKALTQADGDFEKAIEILREQGLAAANKKAGRIAAEGMVYAVSFDNCAVVVEVNAETDFVGKNVPSSSSENVRLFLEEVDGISAVEILDIEPGKRAGAAALTKKEGE